MIGFGRTAAGSIKDLADDSLWRNAAVPGVRGVFWIWLKSRLTAGVVVCPRTTLSGALPGLFVLLCRARRALYRPRRAASNDPVPGEITRGRFAKSAAGPGDNHYFVLGALCHGLFSLKGSRSRVTGSADRRSPSVRPLPGLAGPFRRHTKPFVRRRTCGTRQSRSFENIRDAEFSCSFFKQRDDAVRDTRSSC